MRKSLTAIIFLLLTGFSQLLLANPALVPVAPDIPAKAYMLVDQQSGYVLASKNMNERIAPASLTKLMTAYVVFSELRSGSIKLTDQVKISEKAWRMRGSRMFIEVNKHIKLEDLLKGMIVQSGNDASVALAEYVGGSESAFVTLMNEHAANMGLKNTHFANCTGWPNPDHYTTAHDLAHIAMALIRDFPEYYHLFKIKEFTYNHIKQYNRNRLLWLNEHVDGLKTGHTESAGYCLISSAKQGDMRLVSVVLGTPSDNDRASASRALLNYGFRFYKTFPLYKAHKTLTSMRIWKGKTKTLPLGLEKTLYVTVPRDGRNKIKANMKIDSMIVAPASKGHSYGTVNVMLGKQQLAQRPLVALKDIPEGGLWRKLTDNVLLMFK